MLGFSSGRLTWSLQKYYSISRCEISAFFSKVLCWSRKFCIQSKLHFLHWHIKPWPPIFLTLEAIVLGKTTLVLIQPRLGRWSQTPQHLNLNRGDSASQGTRGCLCKHLCLRWDLNGDGRVSLISCGDWRGRRWLTDHPSMHTQGAPTKKISPDPNASTAEVSNSHLKATLWTPEPC